MSELAYRGFEDDALRVRKERVHTAMLIELLVLLIFLAMAFAFVTKDESSTSRLQSEIDQLRQDLKTANATAAELRSQNDELQRANAELKQSLSRWMNIPRLSLPANDQPVVLPHAQFQMLVDQNQNLKALLDEAQHINGQLRAQLASAKGGGVDLPKCPVTTGFVVNVTLLADGSLLTAPSWRPQATEAARQVPGLTELAASRAMRPDEFSKFAQGIASWGRAQPTPCAFAASVTRRHSDLALYLRQSSIVERYFYVARR